MAMARRQRGGGGRGERHGCAAAVGKEAAWQRAAVGEEAAWQRAAVGEEAWLTDRQRTSLGLSEEERPEAAVVEQAAREADEPLEGLIPPVDCKDVQCVLSDEAAGAVCLSDQVGPKLHNPQGKLDGRLRVGHQ